MLIEEEPHMNTATTIPDALTDTEWQTYRREGWLRLGRIDAQELQALQERIDAIMLGEADIDYDRVLMQLDSDGGDYGSLGAQTRGHKGRSLNYRKIQDLERDPVFWEYMRRPLFADIARRVYGDRPVAIHRAMFMNKPAGRGTVLPMHQDRWTAYDRDPELTIYTALDPATRANGCVEIVPRSHHELINRDHPSGFLTPEQATEHAPPERRIALELEAGEVALLHNWTLHGSDVNRSEQSRRAFSLCLMDADTRSAETGEVVAATRLFD